ncbi:hypothetical protein BJV82DRAFT_573167 [Fennellomyces sp. T-0311]|nr:hypothetical protein BJV82DRAFT_573167 [Fennellomyces sp. T-0311]
MAVYKDEMATKRVKLSAYFYAAAALLLLSYIIYQGSVLALTTMSYSTRPYYHSRSLENATNALYWTWPRSNPQEAMDTMFSNFVRLSLGDIRMTDMKRKLA